MYQHCRRGSKAGGSKANVQVNHFAHVPYVNN